MRVTISCWDIREHSPIRPLDCCSSCHEDDEEGFGGLCELEYEKDNNYVFVTCCNVNGFLLEEGIELQEKIIKNFIESESLITIEAEHAGTPIYIKSMSPYKVEPLISYKEFTKMQEKLALAIKQRDEAYQELCLELPDDGKFYLSQLIQKAGYELDKIEVDTTEKSK